MEVIKKNKNPTLRMWGKKKITPLPPVASLGDTSLVSPFSDSGSLGDRLDIEWGKKKTSDFVKLNSRGIAIRMLHVS